MVLFGPGVTEVTKANKAKANNKSIDNGIQSS